MLGTDVKLSEEAFERVTGLQLKKSIYEGDGTLYSIKRYPNRVVKIVPRDNEDVQRMIELFEFLKKNRSPAVVRVHKFGKFEVAGQPFYYYVMDKLKPLKDRWNLGDLIDNYLHFGKRLSRYEVPRVKEFVQRARKVEKHYRYGDVHGGNIMRTKSGVLKFVDLESFYI
jgi:hypothetical protein